MLGESMTGTRKTFIIFSAEYLVLVVGILFLVCVLQRNTLSEQLEMILVGGMLLIVALAIAKIFKKLFHKRRPLKRTELFVPFDRYAFPSAHATSLFCITSYMLSQNIWIGTAALGITTLIVIARVESRVHDYIDIAGGFIIGVGVTQYLTPYITPFATTYLVPTLLLS